MTQFLKHKLKFGSWESKNNDTVYYADTDGFVVAFGSLAGDTHGYTDESNPPSTRRQESAANSQINSIHMEVRKGDYWKVVGCSNIYWMSFE